LINWFSKATLTNMLLPMLKNWFTWLKIVQWIGICCYKLWRFLSIHDSWCATLLLTLAIGSSQGPQCDFYVFLMMIYNDKHWIPNVEMNSLWRSIQVQPHMGETHDTKYKVIVLEKFNVLLQFMSLHKRWVMFICLAMFAIGCFTFGLVL
jgi:hypothetical protein